MGKEKKQIETKPIVKKETELKVEEYDYCFNLVTDEKGTRIAVGRTFVSGKYFKDQEDAKAYIDSKPWSLIMATAHQCIKIFDNNQNKQ